ncbi:FKBP12-interacting protein [Zea mays]|uniref:FKBP12-interacting protein n=1 Tax=Zea mays TaxID=4577 RepID=A0A3L6EII7_MAIZE|nr:FKBP12-interacting protein [Zea mays]
MSSPWSPMSLEEEEEIQELDAEEQQDGEQPQQGDGLQQGSTAEARAQQTGKKRARSVANSSTKSEAKIKVEESAPGAATGVILSLRESLQDCKQSLASCQVELEAAKSEIEKWHSAFQSIPAVPSGTSPDPVSVVSYLSNLKSSEESLKEQLEKAKKREAAFIVTFAKREQEIAELKLDLVHLAVWIQGIAVTHKRTGPDKHQPHTCYAKNLVEEKEKKIKELQDNVAAVNFTPSSKLGKMLMAKCRTLQEENEEIGAMASEGKVAILQEELEAKELEVTRLKEETLSQKEGTQEAPAPAPAPVEEGDGAGNDLKPASDPLQVKLES